MFSLLWSEHCAYKHSKLLLRTLPTEGRHVVMGPGENAGAVDVGDGLAVAFKVESHNHPSAVEPFQGAATGVGGILRDIFALGARPIAVLDSLRFGEPDTPSARATCSTAPSPASATTATRSACRRRRRGLLRGALRAELPGQRDGARPRRETRSMIRSAAAGVGNVVVLFGASTGRDGIGGASVLASAELGEADGDKRPTVQVGDPFAEKKLMECSLELLERGLLVAAAGPRRGGPDLLVGRDGVQGRRRHRPRRRARAAARGRHGALRDHGLRVAGADALRLRARARRRRARGVRALGGPRHGDRRGHRHAAAMRILRGDELVGDMPVAALVDDCPRLRPRARSARPRRSTPRPRRRWPRAARCARRCSALLALAEPRLAPAAVRAVRLRSCSRAPCAGPRRPTPPCSRCRDGGGARRVDRRQRPPRGRRPVPRHDRGGARVRGEPRLRRRRAARPDELPELRQPREAAHRLAADRGGPRPRRRVPRARRPGRRRQRLALQRGRRRPDLPDAGRRHGRRAARRRARAGASASRARATRSRSSAGTPRRRWPRCELAKLRGEPLPDGLPAVDLGAGARGARRRSATRCAPARWLSATTSPRAACSWRWPSAASPAAWARRSTSARRRRHGAGSSASGPAGSSLSGPRDALERARRRRGARRLRDGGRRRARAHGRGRDLALGPGRAARGPRRARAAVPVTRAAAPRHAVVGTAAVPLGPHASSACQRTLCPCDGPGHRRSGPALPPGFSATPVLTGLNQPTSVRFAPGGGPVFVAEKRGVVKAFDSLDDATATTVIDLRTDTMNVSDRGLLGLEVDPGSPGAPVRLHPLRPRRRRRRSVAEIRHRGHRR